MAILFCEICGINKNLDRHHVIRKGMGGSRNPLVHDESNLMTLCRQCHRNLHEGRWDLVRSPDGIRVLDRSSGEQVMRRRYNPGLDIPTLFQLLNVAEHSLRRLHQTLPYFSDDELAEAFSYASVFGKRSWVIQAAILHEAQERSIYGERALEAIARRFEIGLRQAQKYALVWKVFFAQGDEQENVNIDVFLLDEPSWYVVAATETREPEKWLAYAQDRKMGDPRYSVTAFRRDIQRARVASIAQVIPDMPSFDEPPGSDVPLPRLERRACPWIKALCVRSGKAVPLSDCSDCEFMVKDCKAGPSWLEE